MVMSEMQLKLEGLPGRALEIMRERGWQMMVSPLETESHTEGSKVLMNITFNTWFAKYGKVQSSEVYQKELREVWEELNGTD